MITKLSNIKLTNKNSPRTYFKTSTQFSSELALPKIEDKRTTVSAGVNITIQPKSKARK